MDTHSETIFFFTGSGLSVAGQLSSSDEANIAQQPIRVTATPFPWNRRPIQLPSLPRHVANDLINLVIQHELQLERQFAQEPM